MSESKTFNQYVAAQAAAFSAFLAGTQLGWTNPAQRSLQEGHMGFTMTEHEFSWVGSALNLGAALICIPSGFLVKSVGRKVTMLLMCIPLLIGWTLITIASSAWFMIIGRFLLGVGTGSFCVATPLYIGEIAQKEIRGKLGSFFQLNITIGILFVFAIGAMLEVKLMTIVCAVLTIIFAVLFLPMPETPTYLIGKDKLDSGIASMQWLRGKEYDVKAEIDDIKTADAKLKDQSVSFGAAMARPASKKALFIGLGLMFFQQLCGINAVIFYSTDIFEHANTGLDAQLSTIFVGVIQVIATFIAVMVVDKLGRRMLLLISASLMAISTALLGLYFFMKDGDPESVKTMGWLPVSSVCLFIVMFSFGFGPVPWLMMGEIFSPDVKGVAASIVATTNWTLAFVVTKTFVNLKEALGNGQTFWLFSFMTVVAIFFVILIVPETKNKSLNEIQDELEGN